MDTGQGGIARANAPDPTSGSVEAAERQPGRPFILWILTLALLASPLIHAVALLLHTRWLNFGSVRPWDGFVYFLIAPIVGVLMLRRHERARFSVYVFLSCEILRAIRIHSAGLGLLAVGFLLSCNCPHRVASIRPSIHTECWLDSGCDAPADVAQRET